MVKAPVRARPLRHATGRSSWSFTAARIALTAGVSLLALIVPSATGPAVAESAAEPLVAEPLVVGVSPSTPYQEPVTITVADLPAGKYDVYYFALLMDPESGATTLLGELAGALANPSAAGQLFEGSEHSDGDFVRTIDEWFGGEVFTGEVFTLPGIIAVVDNGTNLDTIADGDLSPVRAVSAQMFPGAVGNGAPVFTIEGPGFVDGAFIAGGDIEVTATGFRAGTEEFSALAWMPAEPSTGDVTLDFWRDYLNDIGCDSDDDRDCLFDSTVGFDTYVQGESSAVGTLDGKVARGTAPSAGMSIWVYHTGTIEDTSPAGTARSFFGYDTFSLATFVASLAVADDAADDVPDDVTEKTSGDGVLVLPSVTCSPLPVQVGALVTCTVTGGEAGIDILWRAAYNPTFAEAGVTLDASGSGEFSFVVPAAAFGQPITVELVEWLAPVSLGVSGGPVPTSVPSGGGPVPVWPLGLLALAGVLVLRRRAFGPAAG